MASGPKTKHVCTLWIRPGIRAAGVVTSPSRRSQRLASTPCPYKARVKFPYAIDRQPVVRLSGGVGQGDSVTRWKHAVYRPDTIRAHRFAATLPRDRPAR